MKEPTGAEPPGQDSSSTPTGTKRGRGDDAYLQGAQNSQDNEVFYKPYNKPGYKRIFPENQVSTEYIVYVESTNEGERLGNKNPDMICTLFKNEIKGVVGIKRVNANKLGITFSQNIHANNFLCNENFLKKYNYKAYIPARSVEIIGVLRFVPKNISNEELFKKLSSLYEIINIRRFTHKVNGTIVPYGSVSVTFLSQQLPDFVYLDLYRFKVFEYVAPLLQCYKCFKFNHGAKFCKSTQKCSVCAGEHHFSTCDKEAIIKCINCQGPHLAISRYCPIKKIKIEEKYNKKNYAQVTASLKNNGNLHPSNYSTNFPKLTMTKEINKTKKMFENDVINKNSIQTTEYVKVQTVDRPSTVQTNKNTKTEIKKNETLNTKDLAEIILKNEDIITILVKTLVQLGNSSDAEPITFNSIKEVLKKSLVFNHG